MRPLLAAALLTVTACASQPPPPPVDMAAVIRGRPFTPEERAQREADNAKLRTQIAALDAERTGRRRRAESRCMAAGLVGVYRSRCTDGLIENEEQFAQAQLDARDAMRKAREDARKEAHERAMAGCRANGAYAAHFDDLPGLLEAAITGSNLAQRRAQRACESWHRAYGTPGF
jgi:hypothetical protein